MTIEQELAQALADRDAAREQAQKNFADLTVAREQLAAKEAADHKCPSCGYEWDDEKDEKEAETHRDSITKELREENERLKADLSKVQQDFQTYKDGETQRFNALLTAELGKMGHPMPVQTGSTTTLPGKNQKPDTSNLTGLAKARALLEARQKQSQ